MTKQKKQLAHLKLLENRLISKGIDFFVYALEAINNPTIKYRSENFSFNVCTAWELVLKAQIIRDFGENSIYYKNNKDRTLSLQNCLDKVFTDINNPIKKNIEIIAKLRNQATHFITPEYDGLYITFFQANVLYFVEYMKTTFGNNLNEKLPSYFLTVATDPKEISDIKLIERVDKDTFNNFLKLKRDLITENSIPGHATSFEVRMKSVKKNEDLTFKIDGSADVSTQVISRLLDPSNSHPYRQKDIIRIVNEEYGIRTLNQYTFRCIRHYERLEESDEFYYHHAPSNSKSYSQKALDLFMKNIKDVPNYVEKCTQEYKKK